jgi:hypothetical protein
MDQPQGTFDTSHYVQSSLREKLLEHVFIGELLRCLWRSGRRDIEVLRAEIDASGYDLVLECNGVLRHVQFKSSYRSSYRDARTRDVTVHVNLSKKPSGCVIWIVFDADTLKLGPFLWFGAPPRQPLPALGDRIARQARATPPEQMRGSRIIASSAGADSRNWRPSRRWLKYCLVRFNKSRFNHLAGSENVGQSCAHVCAAMSAMPPTPDKLLRRGK